MTQQELEGVETTIDDIERVIGRYHVKKMERLAALAEEKELKTELMDAVEDYYGELAEIKPGLRVYRSFHCGVRVLVSREEATKIKTEEDSDDAE